MQLTAHLPRAAARAIPVLSLALALLGPIKSLEAFELGHRILALLNESRDRQVPVEVYYPAENAGEEVPVDESPDAGFPVIAYGHGFLMPDEAYANIRTALVPEGYIVALPTTGWELTLDYAAFGQDLAFVLQAFQDLNTNSGTPFHERITPAAAIGGHSMGGGASFLHENQLEYIRALFSIAAAETNPSAIEAASGISLPVLLFAGFEDCVTPVEIHQQPLYDVLASDRKTRLDPEHGWTEGSPTYLEELHLKRLCCLGDELAGVLWDYLNTVSALEREQGISAEPVFRRGVFKYRERVEGIVSGKSRAEIKAMQKARLAEEQKEAGT